MMCMHRTAEGECLKFTVPPFISFCVDGPCPYEQLSNADRIRGMSDEELAGFLLEWIICDKEEHLCHPREYKSSGKCDGKCIAGRLDWLRQPAKEAANE